MPLKTKKTKIDWLAFYGLPPREILESILRKKLITLEFIKMGRCKITTNDVEKDSISAMAYQPTTKEFLVSYEEKAAMTGIISNKVIALPIDSVMNVIKTMVMSGEIACEEDLTNYK